MKEGKGKVLVVEDDASMGALLVKDLGRRKFDVQHVTSAAEALALIEHDELDVVVSDVRLGGMHGLELCERVNQERPELPVVLITAFGDLETAIAAIRAGARDFMPKPFEVEELALRLSNAIELKKLRGEVRRLREGTAAPLHFDDMIGESPAMQRVLAIIERIAQSDAPVLVSGETGTGKELVARALHTRGKSPNGPFIAINCAAVSEALLESELFGHVKGAFTDAHASRAGLFVEASGGTLFLDEIAEMQLPLQAKLLRALQERKVRPVGGDREVPFDARIISASHRDLESAATDGTFREDLFYRLNVLQVHLPPLRERGTDILVLANAYLRRIAERTNKSVTGIDPEAARKLVNYAWPGNVRELVNAIERAMALAQYDVLTVADLPDKIRAFAPSHVLVTGSDATELVSLDEVERRYIVRVLEAVNGNRTRAAEILKIDRKTLYTRLKEIGWKADE